MAWFFFYFFYELSRYVDDTCCIFMKGVVDGLLHHLNSIRATIKFGWSLSHSLILVNKVDGKIRHYCIQTHTDRTLGLIIHHMQRVFTTREENDIFKGNGYPRSFVCFASAAKPPREHDGKGEEDKPSTVHFPYVAGVSERILSVSKDFKSEPTLRPFPMEKQASKHCLLCTCTKVYIGETTRRLETRLKEHKDA